MIICSCAVISDRDIEDALIEIMAEPEPLLPTPGVIYRQLGKKLGCCGCVPLTVTTIYDKLNELEIKGLVCPYRTAEIRARFSAKRSRLEQKAKVVTPDTLDEMDFLIAAE